MTDRYSRIPNNQRQRSRQNTQRRVQPTQRRVQTTQRQQKRTQQQTQRRQQRIVEIDSGFITPKHAEDRERARRNVRYGQINQNQVKKVQKPIQQKRTQQTPQRTQQQTQRTQQTLQKPKVSQEQHFNKFIKHYKTPFNRLNHLTNQ